MKYTLDDLFDEHKLTYLAKDDEKFVRMNIVYDMLPLKNMMKYNIKVNPAFVRRIPSYILTEECVTYLYNENYLTDSEKIELSQTLNSQSKNIKYIDIVSNYSVLNSWFNDRKNVFSFSKLIDSFEIVKPLTADIINLASDKIVDFLIFKSAQDRRVNEDKLIDLFTKLPKDDIKNLSPAFFMSGYIKHFLTIEQGNTVESFFKNAGKSPNNGIYEFIVTGDKKNVDKFAENYSNFHDELIFHYIHGDILGDLTKFGDFFTDLNKSLKNIGSQEIKIEDFIKSLSQTAFFTQMLNSSDSFLLLEQEKHGIDYSIGDFYKQVIHKSSSHVFTEFLQPESILPITDKPFTRLHYIFSHCKDKQNSVFLNLLNPEDWDLIDSILDEAPPKSNIFRKLPLSFMRIVDKDTFESFLTKQSFLPINVHKTTYKMFASMCFKTSYSVPEFIEGENITKFMSGVIEQMPDSLNKILVIREILLHAKQSPKNFTDSELDYWVSKFNIPDELKHPMNKVFLRKKFNDEDVETLLNYGDKNFNIINTAYDKSRLGYFSALSALNDKEIDLILCNESTDKIWDDLSLFKNIPDNFLDVLPEDRLVSLLVEQILFFGESLINSKDNIYYDSDMSGEFSFQTKDSVNIQDFENSQYVIDAYLRKILKAESECKDPEDDQSFKLINLLVREIKFTHKDNPNMIKAFDALSQKISLDINEDDEDDLFYENKQMNKQDVLKILDSRIFEDTCNDWLNRFERSFKPGDIINFKNNTFYNLERTNQYLESQISKVLVKILIDKLPEFFIEYPIAVKDTNNLKKLSKINHDFSLKNWNDIESWLTSIYKKNISLSNIEITDIYASGLTSSIVATLKEKDVNSYIEFVEKSKLEDLGLYSFLVSNEIFSAINFVSKGVHELELKKLIDLGAMKEGLTIVSNKEIHKKYEDGDSFVLNCVINSLFQLKTENEYCFSRNIENEVEMLNQDKNNLPDIALAEVHLLREKGWNNISLESIFLQMSNLNDIRSCDSYYIENFIQLLGESDSGVLFLNHLKDKGNNFNDFFNLSRQDYRVSKLEDEIIGEKIVTKYDFLIKAVLIKSQISKQLNSPVNDVTLVDSFEFSPSFKM